MADRKKIKVYTDEILYIESMREYIRIVMTARVVTTKLQIGEVEKMLPAGKFVRIHRSFIIASDRVEAFSAAEVEVSGKQLPIGKSYKEEVLQRLDKHS